MNQEEKLTWHAISESIMTREGLCELYKQVIGYNPDLDPAGKSDWTESEMLETLKKGMADGHFSISVLIHPYRWNNGDQEYHSEVEECDGFCVYTRIDLQTLNDPFEVLHEQDFETLDAARAHGEARAALFGVQLEMY